MAMDEALAYLVALSAPVWLLVEHAVLRLRSRLALREKGAHAEMRRPAGAGAAELPTA